MKFHHLGQHLLDTNCLLLILKMFGLQEVTNSVVSKVDSPENKLSRSVYRCTRPLTDTFLAFSDTALRISQKIHNLSDPKTICIDRQSRASRSIPRCRAVRNARKKSTLSLSTPGGTFSRQSTLQRSCKNYPRAVHTGYGCSCSTRARYTFFSLGAVFNLMGYTTSRPFSSAC